MKNFKNLKEFLKSKIVKTSIACLLLTSVVGSMIPIHSYARTEDGYYEWTDFVSAGSIEGYNEIIDDYNKLYTYSYFQEYDQIGRPAKDACCISDISRYMTADYTSIIINGSVTKEEILAYINKYDRVLKENKNPFYASQVYSLISFWQYKAFFEDCRKNCKNEYFLSGLIDFIYLEGDDAFASYDFKFDKDNYYYVAAYNFIATGSLPSEYDHSLEFASYIGSWPKDSDGNYISVESPNFPDYETLYNNTKAYASEIKAYLVPQAYVGISTGDYSLKKTREEWMYDVTNFNSMDGDDHKLNVFYNNSLREYFCVMDTNLADWPAIDEEEEETTTEKETTTKEETTTQEETTTEEETTVSDNEKEVSASVSYKTHVQKIGWQSFVENGRLSGTEEQQKRLEAIQIHLVDLENISGGIRYKTHVQKNGWQPWVENGASSGTTGSGLRLEAIKIELTGDIADVYDIYYNTHIEKIGWSGWAKNGETSGSAGYGLRLEAIHIKLVKKDANGNSTAPTTIDDFACFDYYNTPVVSYRTHVQKTGWQSWVRNNKTSGTVGKGLRLEAIQIKITDNKGTSGGITYSTHVEKKGWMSWVNNGVLSGTSGKGLRLEAIDMKLTGDLANQYSILYRVHAQHFGWMGWAKDGANAGTSGYGYRLEGIQIVIIDKSKTRSDLTIYPVKIQRNSNPRFSEK